MANSFRGMVLRTDPNYGVGPNATSRIVLLKADEIVMNDGTVVANWPVLVADATLSGAGGLDTGSLAPNTWWDVYAIRNSVSGNGALIIHRHKCYTQDQAQINGPAQSALLSDSTRQRLAQSFIPAISGKVEIIDIPVQRVGAPTGNIWLTIEADNSGVPSGVPLATSDKIGIVNLNTATPPDFNLRAVFRSPANLTAGTSYWIVMYGDFAASPSNYIQWCCAANDAYPRGVPAVFNGSAWSVAVTDLAFKEYVTQYDSPLVMPGGFDQDAQLGFFYSNLNAPYFFDPMIFNDRRATWLIRSTGGGGSDLEGFGCSVLCIRDANIVFPHGLPVVADIVVGGSSAETVTVAGLPEGYARKPGDWDNADTGYVQGAGQYVFAGRVSTEYGGLYVSTSAGTATVLVPSFEW